MSNSVPQEEHWGDGNGIQVSAQKLPPETRGMIQATKRKSNQSLFWVP